MGKSSSIFSVSVGTSVTEGGDPNANTLLPNPGAATFIGIPTTTGSVDAFSFSEGSNVEDHGKRSPGSEKAVALAVINNSGGALFGSADGEALRSGFPDEVTISHRLRPNAGNDPLAVGFGKILGSSLALHSPSVASATTTAASADGTTFVVADADAPAIGAPVRFRPSGKIVDEYAIVTGKSSDGTDTTCTIHPTLSFTPGNAETVTYCYAFYPVIGRSNCAANDFHCRLDVGGLGTDASVRTSLSGCRMSGFTISNNDGAASLELRFKPLVALQDDANADAIAASEPPGKVLMGRYGARCDIAADHNGASAPISTARTALNTYDHTITTTIETAPGTPETRSIMLGATHEVNNATCTINLLTEREQDLQRMLVLDRESTFVLGFGPSGDGEGAAFIAHCGRASGDANIAAGEGSRIEQSTDVVALADFKGCDQTGLNAAEKRLASAPFLLCFPKK